MASELSKKFAQPFTRSSQRVANNLGIVAGTSVKGTVRKVRRDDLKTLQDYYDSKQYDSLIGWEEAAAQSCAGDHVPVRKRKPRLIMPLPKLVCSRIASKLVGEQNFPELSIEDSPEDTAFIKALVKSAKLQSRLQEPLRKTLALGSAFARFAFKDGAFTFEQYSSNYCYPEFDPAGQLLAVRIQYVYADPAELDEKGKPREKWFRMDLGRETDIMYDSPNYSSTSEPQFQVVESVTHNLGFVQGTWFRTMEDLHSPDGFSLYADGRDFCDSINYSLSQSDVAVSYNQDPQLVIKGMDSEEMDTLMRSAAKAWNLGRDGEASLLESSLSGVEKAIELRDKVGLAFQHMTRVIMMDPEKMVAHAQSGEALKVLHGPMVDLVHELRPMIEASINELILKIAITTLVLNQRGEQTFMVIPPGYKPQSLDISATWPPVFALTMEDMQKKLSLGIQASNASVVSREFVLRWMAKDFGIDDIETELAKIAAQPVLNPFGAF